MIFRGALESIFQSQTEISFKFALFNAILSEEDITKRNDIFALLKKLYKERSNIVHGNRELDAKWFEENWVNISKIAKLSIIKKIDFLTQNQPNDWQKHLDELALGVA